jgi:hypothetical protein
MAPRKSTDALDRYRVYGPIQPMVRPSFLERIFGRR